MSLCGEICLQGRAKYTPVYLNVIRSNMGELETRPVAKNKKTTAHGDSQYVKKLISMLS